MSEVIGQPGGAARPMGIGEILSTAFQLYQRYWRTLLAIAAVVVVPLSSPPAGLHPRSCETAGQGCVLRPLCASDAQECARSQATQTTVSAGQSRCRGPGWT
jgi:hypothetical protein